MSLKDNVNAIKEELSAEEQFLESVIKAEGFWKKYKKIIFALGALLVIGVLAKGIMAYLHESNMQTSNVAYASLMKNPEDAQALASLKSSNPKMYEMFLFKTTVQSADAAKLEATKSEISDPILSNLLNYQIASLKGTVSAASMGVAQDFALFQEGYTLLKSDKIKEANAKFDQIPMESSLRNVVANLKHYMGK